MYKKIILIIIIFLISGCSIESISDRTLEKNVEYAINQDIKLFNVHNRGFRYYLPAGFKVIEDSGYNQTLLSNGVKFYLNVDIVSYYNNNDMGYTNTEEAYSFMVLNYNQKNGYLKIIKNKDDFLVEIVYNYAIIELQIEESKLYEAVINASYILSSIRYNNVVIANVMGGSIFESSEKLYEIFAPKEPTDPREYLDYYKEESYQEDKLQDLDVINN